MSGTIIDPLVERLFRDEAGRLLALLTRLLGPVHDAVEDVARRGAADCWDVQRMGR